MAAKGLPFGIRVDVLDTVADLLAVATSSDAAMVEVTRKGTAYLQARVKVHASGRPGPRVQTGDYRRGISRVDGFARGAAGGRVAVGEVFSNSPQARRLEFGFVGTDAAGRTYHQPAFPHWGPALVETERYLDALAAKVALGPLNRSK